MLAAARTVLRVSTWFTEDTIIPTIAGALEDFTSLNPLANIPESRLEDFENMVKGNVEIF